MIKNINNVIERLTRIRHCEERSDEAIAKRINSVEIASLPAVARNDISGQTTLILILLTAAALIFLAIVLNWGRIAQTKSLVTVAADQAATLLASDAASYGEMEKQTYLNNENKKSALTGVLMAIIAVVVAVIVAVLMFVCPPAGLSGGMLILAQVLAVVGAVMSVVSLSLQIAVVQPGVTALWNKLQKSQPIQQQFFEEGISTALQGAVTDQVNITDYLDWNANGVYGNNSTSGFPNDTVGRFAVFYSDRLKMLNQGIIPQVVSFYNQLGELMNGETCAQNASDNQSSGGSIPINPACTPAVLGVDCSTTPTDPACQVKIPKNFQLNDACSPNSVSTTATYNPYCDPCCQPLSVPNPYYNNTSAPNDPLQPLNFSVRPGPTVCPDQSAIPAQCYVNNPYNSSPGSNDSPYPLLYDPTYQNYANGLSFLVMFGRDQQMGPFSTNLNPQGSSSNGVYFPNGIYPFFWLMKDYSPEVDNINPGTVTSAQYHWCTAAVPSPMGYAPPTPAVLAEFPDLAQVTLPSYSCTGPDCCVNFLAGCVSGGSPTPCTSVGTNNNIDLVGSSSNPAGNPALDPSFGEGGTGSWLEGDNQLCSVVSGTTTSQCTDGTACTLGSSCSSVCADDTPCSPVGSTCPSDGSTCSGGGMCSYPTYNGASTGYPDGSCEWTGTISSSPTSTPTVVPGTSTVDNLDDTMHTLSDFVNFSDNFLNQDVGTLSATFSNWYAQISDWISSGNSPCDDNSTCVSNKCTDGTACTGPTNGRLLPLPGYLGTWNTVITNWLGQNFTPSGATNATDWCMPPESTLLNGNSSTPEDTYINTTGAANDANLVANDPSFTSQWGDMGYVLACLNYNATIAPTNFAACSSVLTSPTCAASYSATAPAACSSITTAVRSLAGPAPLYDGCTGQYAQWVANSQTLATDEAPKFASRYLYLEDIYTRAQTMQTIFSQGATNLQNFLSGPAAQLILASQKPPVANLPNSVIYGWVDNSLPDGEQGYAHLVKVTAFSPGRIGQTSNIFDTSLPFIKTASHAFTRDYTLDNRDGYVYVSIKRWDQDHRNALTFPNNHQLWQFIFHRPSGTGSTGTGLQSACIALNPNGVLSSPVGFGLMPGTVLALSSSYANANSTDMSSLAKAFMLNDEGDGSVDPANLNADGTKAATCLSGNSSAYCQCLNWADSMLANGVESHACAEYIASSPASNPSSVQNGTSQNPDADYSLKFVDCSSVPNMTNPPPDDLQS